MTPDELPPKNRQGPRDSVSPEFDAWWDSDCVESDSNPYTTGSPIYWAWAGWKAAKDDEWRRIQEGATSNE